ncbi:PA14 domain-containing protein [Lentisphaerota bacterium WC36G]|nr:hypothetical protein LJT99_09680 [Lentisphaerae bacterium WC36]UDQ97768.1 hypothetical protein LJT99_15130 [Lentisphaerae bacterium WC36]UDQ98435.1 hypothetical protein LJT99_02620 [Lentisphaerae bacterium WC36]
MKLLKQLSVGGILLLGSGNLFAVDNDLVVSYNELTANSMQLNWQNLSNAKGYQIFCNDQLLLTTKNNSYVFNNLLPNQDYNFSIKALDDDGNEIKTGSNSITTLAANNSNYFLLNSYAFDQFGAKVSYYDGVEMAMNELFPTHSEYMGKYDDPQKWYNFYNINARTPYKTQIRNDINFNFFERSGDTILDSGKSRFAAMTFDGFFVASEDGEYTFRVEHDNSFILEIDGKEVFNDMKYCTYEEKNIFKVNLKAGVHRAKITYYEFSGDKSTLLMEYAGPTFGYRPLDGYSFVQLNDNVQSYLATDADFDGVADSLEAEKGSSNSSWDTDNDGLTDYEEIVQFNSQANQKDSDNDGIDDGIEAKIINTNLLVADNNNNENFFSNVNKDVQNDKLTLSWNYNGPSVAQYKIYRNLNLVGSTTDSTYSLPMISENDVYYIVAVDTEDKCNYRKVNSISLSDDQQAYLNWKRDNNVALNSLYDADYDGDGRKNLLEYQLDTNPAVKPLENINNITKVAGLLGSFSDKMWAPESLQNLNATNTEVYTDINFNAGEGEVLNSGKTDGVYAFFKGYFTAPTTGVYKFLTAYDDAVTISIDGVEVFSDGSWNPVGSLWSKHLKAGMHFIEIEYHEGVGAAMLDLKWAPPGAGMEPMAGDVFWHITKKSAELDEYIAWDKDSDGDGLTNAYELEHGTDMNNADSDNDGINDYDEINKYNTDPNNADSDGDGISDGDEVNKFNSNPNVADVQINSYVEMAKLDGSEFESSLGAWTKDETSAKSACAIGALEYKFTTEEAGVFQLNVKSTLKASCDYKVDVYCDDVLVISEKIDNAAENSDYDFSDFMQHLTAGEHTIKILFDNPTIGNTLIINEIEVLKPICGDANNDGVDDWLANYAKNNSKLDKVSASSKVSPVIIEGINKFAETLKVNDESVEAFNGENWHKEISLSQNDSENNFNFNFQNGLKTVTKNIKWEPTNIIAEGDVVTVKKGSAMLLTAMPATENSEYSNANVSVNNVNYPVTENAPKKVTFTEVKNYEITGSYKNAAGETVENTLTVKVVDYSFEQENLTMTTSAAAVFNIPEVSEEMYLEVTGDVDNALSDGSELLIHSREWNQAQAVIVRNKETDQIIATLPIELIRFYGIGQTSFQRKATYEDGTLVMELDSICYPMKENYSIEYKIFLSGVAFEDGTVNKTFNSSQFDATGMSKVRFVKTPAAPKTAACHHATFKIDGEKVQELY